MTVIKKKLFDENLKTIVIYIAKNNPVQAKKFKNHLRVKMESIPNFPHKSRKSLYYEDENTRDLIFKGYTIPYLIDNNKQHIVILDIFKWINK